MEVKEKKKRERERPNPVGAESKLNFGLENKENIFCRINLKGSYFYRTENKIN